MNVLIYTRPKSETFFRNVVNGVFSYPNIVTYSDYNRIADVWAGDYIYNDKYDRDNAEFEKEVDDILPRCRTLRKMPPELAYKLARRYWNGIEEFFSNNNFDYLFTIPVDCYSLDIICRLAEKKGIHIISLIGSAFGGNAKLTVRGEYTKVREFITDEEVDQYVSQMTQVNYLSASEIKNVKKNHKSIYMFYVRRMLIEYGYYPIMKLIDHDPWNYHYNIYEVKGIPLKNRFNKTFEDKFKRLDNITFNPKTTVYYPLHLIPEATTDYWCLNVKEAADYNHFVLNIVKNADPGITFIIKEHPAMYGRRLLSFYDELNALANVILLHPMDRSNALLLKVDNVVVDNGTVGIEALLRKKRLLCLSDNYYRSFHPNAHMIHRVSRESLEIPLADYDNKLFMRSLLQGIFPSDFRNSQNGIPSSSPQQVIDGIRTYIDINGLPI